MWVRTLSTSVGLFAGPTFRDSEFAGFYCADNGRDSVPPSLLATALLLQTHDKVSDAEAKARAFRHPKVALGIEIEDRPFAKSTLQVFRAQLISTTRCGHASPACAWLKSGYLKKRGMRVALDTTNILGRGAVPIQPAGGLDRQTHESLGVRGADREWAEVHGYGRYKGSSIKAPVSHRLVRQEGTGGVAGHDCG